MPHLFRTKYILFLICILFLCQSGCAWVSERKKLFLEEVRKKQEAYDTLYKALATRRISPDMSSQEINEMFGPPDDKFESDSGISRFEIWTYEKVAENGEPDLWHPIRLYFNNDKLIRWNF